MANIFTRAFNVIRGSNVVAKQNGGGGAFQTILQQGFTDLFGASTGANALGLYQGWVYACVQAISQEVARTDLKLIRRTADGEMEVEQHPLIDLLRSVNGRMTLADLIETTQAHQELEGNAFWFLARDRMGQVREIWPLRPDRVEIKQSKEDPLLVGEYIYKQKDGRKVVFPREQIIHFAQFNSEGDYPFPVRGTGTVQAAALAIDTNELSRQWNKTFFKNSAIPNIVLQTEGALTPEEYQRVKRQWHDAHGGVDNSHKTTILENGLKVDKLNSSQKDMDFVEQVKTSRDEILGIFRVPKSVLGITEDVNRANAQAANWSFARWTIEPKMRRLVDTLNEMLVPIYGSDLELTFESPVPEDREQIVAEYTQGVDRWLTINEVRELEGLPPISGGDTLRNQFGIPIGSVEEEEPDMADEDDTEDDEDVAEIEDSNEERSATEIAAREAIDRLFKGKKEDPKIEPRWTEERKELFFDAWQKDIQRNEDDVLPVLAEFFELQEERFINALGNELNGVEQREYKLKAVADLMPDSEEEIERLINLMTPRYFRWIEEQGETLSHILGSTITLVTTETVQDFVDQRAKELSEMVNETTFKKAAPIIEEGIRKGESIGEISEKLRDQVFGGDDEKLARAKRIARTEVSEASNFANLEGMRNSGAEKKQWIVFAPEDAACAFNADDGAIDIDKEFSSGDDRPPAHPNCVCTLISVFDE